MEFKVESMGALCELKNDCNINGIDIDKDDFVEQRDTDPENAEDYGCGNMTATIICHTSGILEKYKISSEEYYEVANKIASELSFGYCGWCI